MDFEQHRASVQDRGDILMSQTFADFEFYAQDCDATGGTNTAEKGHTTDGNGHWLQMSTKVVRQRARRQVFSDLGSCLKIQMGMNVFVKTGVHHSTQFAPDLRGRMQEDGQEAFLQPTVEVFDGTVAPRFVLGDKGEVDPDQQCQPDEAIERTGMGGQTEQIAVVDLQGLGQSQPLPGSHDKRQTVSSRGLG